LQRLLASLFYVCRNFVAVQNKTPQKPATKPLNYLSAYDCKAYTVINQHDADNQRLNRHTRPLSSLLWLPVVWQSLAHKLEIINYLACFHANSKRVPDSDRKDFSPSLA
jgi:hypothetical protein